MSKISDQIPHIWERLESDTNKSWAAFVFYRDMPPGERSLVGAYCRYRASQDPSFDPSTYKNNSPPGNWGKWAADGDWAIRAEARDRYMDILTMERSEVDHVRELGEYRNRELHFARLSSNAAIEMLTKTLAAVHALEVEDISPAQIPKILMAIAALYDKSAEAERRALAVDKILELVRDQGLIEPVRH